MREGGIVKQIVWFFVIEVVAVSVTITESGVGIKSIDIIIFFALQIFIGFFSVANGSVKETVKDEEFEPYLQQAPHQVSL